MLALHAEACAFIACLKVYEGDIALLLDLMCVNHTYNVLECVYCVMITFLQAYRRATVSILEYGGPGGRASLQWPSPPHSSDRPPSLQ